MTTTSASTSSTATWHSVCSLADITPNTGAAALIGKRQIAVVRVVDRSGGEQLYGLSNWCPFAKAMVISRGIVGSKGDIPKISSPLYKQGFDLRSGQCLDDPTVTIPVYPVRINGGMVQVAC